MKANYTTTPEEYARERDAALLSLDEKRIRTFCKKHGVRLPPSEEAFWPMVHKSITAILNLPIARWLEAAEWLEAHDYTVLCDRWTEAEKYIQQKEGKG